LVAVVKSVLNFGPWLFGQHTTIYTDHSPLLSIFQNTSNNQYIRLLSQIDSYSYDLIYIKGEKNPADFISRLEENDKREELFNAHFTKVEKFEVPEVESLNHEENYTFDDPWIEEADNLDNEEIAVNVLTRHQQILKGNSSKKEKKEGDTCHLNPSITNNQEKPAKRGRGRPKKNQENQTAKKVVELTEKEINDKIMMTDNTALREMTFEYIKESQMIDENLKCEDFIEKNKLTCIDGLFGVVENKSFKVYVPNTLINDVVNYMHMQGHYGVEKLYRSASQKYCSENLRQICQKICNQCFVCQSCNPIKRTNNYESTIAPDFPNQIWSIDLTGYYTFNSTRQAVIVCVDGFSKFLMTSTIKETNDVEIIKCISTFIYRYGKPIYIVTDNASNLMSTLITDFFQSSAIIHKTTTAYRHDNRYAEIYIKLLEDMVAKVRQDSYLKSKSLDECLEIATFYINKGIQPCGFSSFQIYTYQPAEMLESGILNRQFNESNSLDNYIYKRQLVYNSIYTDEAFRKLRSKDGQIFKHNPFKIGDTIIVKKGFKDDGHKWDTKNDGLFKIVGIDPFHVWYRKNGRKLFKTHFSDVKKVNGNLSTLRGICNFCF
uniref:RNA-directed DNA polymerase n=1 Tax=Strongyloides papillosus TaxID=174720 RepID=A0A0N5CDN3_STREA